MEVPKSIIFRARGATPLRHWGNGGGYSLYLTKGLVEKVLGSQDENGRLWVRLEIDPKGFVRLLPADDLNNLDEEEKIAEEKFQQALAKLDASDLMTSEATEEERGLQ